MNKIEARNIQIETIDLNGKENQLNQLVEEAAELIVSIMKYKRYGTKETRIHLINLISEIIDVKNMIEQIEIILQKETVDYKELLEDEYNFKLKRQDKRNLDKELNEYMKDGGRNPNLKHEFGYQKE